ncbi:MAG: type I 3-dehydroquinate dehydratase [Clostridia bacterium]
MIRPITIKNVTIGEGVPKIIVPITEQRKTDIIEKAHEIALMDIHMVEWRSDFYVDVADTAKVLATLKDLRNALGKKILLFTFRTMKEGGDRAFSEEDYLALNLAVASSGNVDVVDVEVLSLGLKAKAHIAALQSTGTLVIGSNHDFYKTPARQELVDRLCAIQAAGADIPKLAVMPQSKEDVLELLSATQEMFSRHANRPIITMSMASMGVISRLSGEVFGSAMTFGAVGRVSAPGQIPVEQLAQGLAIIHSAS